MNKPSLLTVFHPLSLAGCHSQQRHSLLLLCTLLCFTIAGRAETNDGSDSSDRHIRYEIRLGVNIGGTMPIGMPETIRGLNSYNPRFNPGLAGYIDIPLPQNFGIQTGVRIERKAMKSDARVKTYQMAMVREGNEIAGVFTGNVHTEVNMWGVTIPVYATYTLSRYFDLRLGPYITILFDRNFSGYAYDGYMRLGDPTGERVDVGSDETTRGSYDFSSDMRHFQYGVDLGVDWHFSHSLGLFADFQWGLNNIFKGSFHTISQTMYPLYGTIGIFKIL